MSRNVDITLLFLLVILRKFADQSPLDLAAQKPQIFSLLSQHLATQFKGRNRTASLDSIGPESPIYPKDGSFRACSAERNNNCGSEYHSVHSGFNPVSIDKFFSSSTDISPLIK